LDHDYLAVHLKMTGRLYVADQEAQFDADRWVHFRLDLDQGKQLRFSDSRKFGRIYLTSDLADITGQLGPEPLEDEFTVEELYRCLGGRKRGIKPLLLDQSVIAGVGNIYADEALFRARIHPLTPANRLTKDDLTRLHEAIRHVLQMGIQYEGASINWYRKPDGTMGESQEHFLAYDREGEPCVVCGTIMQKIRVAQRGTHICPVCQPFNHAEAVR
jgi:formamidopyrimidine-DNA glycosylase